MSWSWDNYRVRARITFRTRAPNDAPETKGTRCWFKPEWLEWHVTSTEISVLVSGHATRTKHMQGEVRWDVEGTARGDERPAWLMLPLDQITAARLAAEDIDGKREEITG